MQNAVRIHAGFIPDTHLMRDSATAAVLPEVPITYNKEIPTVLDKQPKKDKESKRIEQAATQNHPQSNAKCIKSN